MKAKPLSRTLTNTEKNWKYAQKFADNLKNKEVTGQ